MSQQHPYYSDGLRIGYDLSKILKGREDIRRIIKSHKPNEFIITGVADGRDIEFLNLVKPQNHVAEIKQNLDDIIKKHSPTMTEEKIDPVYKEGFNSGY